jgi:hypothetical protein
LDHRITLLNERVALLSGTILSHVGVAVTDYAKNKIIRHAHRVSRIGAIIARDDLELLSQHAAGGIDLIRCEINSLAGTLVHSRDQGLDHRMT